MIRDIFRSAAGRALLGSAAISTLISALPAHAEPARIYNQHPLAAIHLSAPPQSAATLPSGSFEFRFSGSISNTVNRERDEFLIDSQSHDGSTFAAFALSDTLQIEAHQAVLYRGAGDTDHLIEEWHNTFGLPDGPRVRIPENQFEIGGQTDNGTTFQVRRKGAHLSGLDLSAKWRFLSTDTVDVSIAPSLRLPTGAESYGPESTDFGTTLLIGCQRGDWQFNSGISYLYFSEPQLGELLFERHHFGFFASAEYDLTESVSLLAGLLAESALLENVIGYPDFQSYIDVGFRYRIGPTAAFEIVIRENPGPDDATTDITLYGALTLRFGGDVP